MIEIQGNKKFCQNYSKNNCNARQPKMIISLCEKGHNSKIKNLPLHGSIRKFTPLV